MEAIVIRDRYKVVQVLRLHENYAAVRAVDIQDRETPGRLINLYEGPLLHRYGPVYMKLDSRECPAFHDFFLEGSTLAAVFDDAAGTPVNQVFFRGDRWDRAARMEMTELLLHDAMTLTNLPPEICCPALLSENVQPDVMNRKLTLRFLVPPMEGLNGRELALLAGDQMRKILPRRWNTQPVEARFLKSVERGEYQTVVALYAAWKAFRGAMEEEYEKWAKMNFLKKVWTALKYGFSVVRDRIKEQE